MEELNMPIKFDLDNLILKRAKITDAEERFAVYSSNRDYLTKLFVEITNKYNLDIEKKHIRRLQKAWRDGEKYAFSIYHKKDKKYLGEISIMVKDDWSKVYEIGYWIREDYSSKGYTSKVTKFIVDYLEKNFEANRIIISTRVENIPSIKIAKKLGFALESKANHQELFCDKLVDYLYFVKLADKDKQKELESLEPKLKELYGLEF